MDIDRMATQRVLEGIRKYGVVDLDNNRRCFRKEAAEECLDTLNYTRWGYLKNQIPLKDSRRVDLAIRAVIRLIEKSCPGSVWLNEGKA